jgi:hypothetical protein
MFDDVAINTFWVGCYQPSADGLDLLDKDFNRREFGLSHESQQQLSGFQCRLSRADEISG